MMSGGGGRGGGGRGGFGGGGFGGGFGGNFSSGQSAGISTTNAFGLNYSDMWGKKLNVSGSYFFSNGKNVNETETFSPSITTDDRILNLATRSASSSNNNNHRFNMRFEYKLDSNNTIMYIPAGAFKTITVIPAPTLQQFTPMETVPTSAMQIVAQREMVITSATT
ncbi:hypothetical protein [Niabella hibiscisoli]|uniref:hypothetical protein n=1 Tax=Niabella hibiscisoli TaxID=1825928 RepID=UPI001F0DD3F2|nr:hypothetical protein [Niabella hibiscisoli]MCH5715662.1 hypothetical protein [Niabella hibiscisoli]